MILNDQFLLPKRSDARKSQSFLTIRVDAQKRCVDLATTGERLKTVGFGSLDRCRSSCGLNHWIDSREKSTGNHGFYHQI